MVSKNCLEPGLLLASRYLVVKPIFDHPADGLYLVHDKQIDILKTIQRFDFYYFSCSEERRKEAIKDFESAVEILISLKHPFIPQTYEYFTDQQYHYVVTDYIAGEDLSEKIRKSVPLSEKMVVKWMLEICSVLEYIHSQTPPIILKWLMPDKIRIKESSNEAFLYDFDLSRFLFMLNRQVCGPAPQLGYVGVEIFTGKSEPRSDVHSLGAIMFHLLTGINPQDNYVLTFDFNKSPSPKEINPKLSPEINHIIRKSVEYKPFTRFSVAELKAALENLLNSLLLKESGDVVPPTNIIINRTATHWCKHCNNENPYYFNFCRTCGIKLIR